MPAARTSVVILILAGSFACHHEPAPPEQGPPYGGTLTIYLADPVENLDPQLIQYYSDWSIASLIFEGLAGSGPDSVTPLLAEGWTRLDEGMRWLVRLRPGVTFHDSPCFPGGRGREVTSDDVVFSFTRGRDGEAAPRDSGLFGGRITAVRALDRYTAEFILSRPYATFLKILVTPPAFIVPPEAAAFYGSSVSEHPVGTGPFRLAVWNRLEGITLVRNPSYWRSDSLGRRLPFLQGVTVRLAGNPSLVVPEFLKGNSELLIVDDPGLRQLQADPGFHRRFRVTTVPAGLTLRFFGITMNRASILSRNPSLRRVLAASYDRERLLRELHGLALEAASLPPRDLLGAAEATHSAGSPTGAPPASGVSGGVTISTSIAAPDVDRMADAVRRCGLTAKVQVRTDGYYEHVVRDRPHLFRVSMQPVYPDPEEYYALFWSKSPPTVNLSGYRSPSYDAVFERSMVEPDPERRRDLFRTLETILRNDAPLILLTHEGPRHYVVPSYVRGLVLRSAVPDVALFWLDRHEDRLE